MRAIQTVSADQLTRLHELLDQQCGIKIGNATCSFIDAGIARLMARLGAASFAELLAIAQQPAADVRDQLVGALISRETHWFRDPECFHFLGTRILPAREEELDAHPGDLIRIWSAGCSTGQEPYSLVMTILDRLWRSAATMGMPSHYEIVATDVSPAALFLAVAGRYNPQAMEAGLPPEFVERYFTAEGRVCTLNPVVRESVCFRQRNLLDANDDLASGPFEIVLLRYVLEYYTDETQAALLDRVADGMTAGGLLFLGQGEPGLSHDRFAAQDGADCHCYRRRA